MDFDEVYKRYPRKIGKSKGLAKAKKTVKTSQDLEDLKQAIENYKIYCKGKETQYIKHFSTFMSEWRDWLDYKEESSHQIDWNYVYDQK